MDKLSEHAIRMLEIADKPYWNEYNMVNKDLKDTHDIAQAVYDIILQVQMLKMTDRKTEPQTNADQHVQHVESVEPMQTEREGE